LATIRTAILSCELAPAVVATEAELSARYGLGLAATRAALARLSALGWIEAEPRRGWRVAPVSGTHLADLLDARRLLEPALRTVVATPERARDLLLQADVYEASSRRPDENHHFAELRLSARCAGAVHRPRIAAWLGETWDLSLRADRWFRTRLNIARPPLPLEALARALARGDGEGAERIAAEMRGAFEDRASIALGFSDAQIAGAHAPLRAPSPLGTSRTDGRTAAEHPPLGGTDR